MQTTARDLHYLPDDEHLAKYEEAVLVIAKRRLIRLLYQSPEPLSLSQMLSRADVSLNSLAAAYADLSKDELVECRENLYLLTNRGRRWAIKNRKNIFMTKMVVTYKETTSPASQVAARLAKRKTLPKSYFVLEIDTNDNAS